MTEVDTVIARDLCDVRNSFGFKIFFEVFFFVNTFYILRMYVHNFRNLYEENQYNLVYRCIYRIIIFLYSVTVLKFFSEVKLKMCLYMNIYILQIMLNIEKKKNVCCYVAFL